MSTMGEQTTYVSPPIVDKHTNEGGLSNGALRGIVLAFIMVGVGLIALLVAVVITVRFV